MFLLVVLWARARGGCDGSFQRAGIENCDTCNFTHRILPTFFPLPELPFTGTCKYITSSKPVVKEERSLQAEFPKRKCGLNAYDIPQR